MRAWSFYFDSVRLVAQMRVEIGHTGAPDVSVPYAAPRSIDRVGPVLAEGMFVLCEPSLLDTAAVVQRLHRKRNLGPY
jgi:hypothetical protein